MNLSFANKSANA